MRDYPQADHCDLGLVEDDHTPDMRKAPVAADALRNESPRSHQPQKEIR